MADLTLPACSSARIRRVLPAEFLWKHKSASEPRSRAGYPMKSVRSNSTPTSTRIASPSTSIWNPSSSMVACCLNSPGQAVQSGSTVQRVVAPAPQCVSPPPPASSSSPGIGPAVCDFHGARRLASPPRGRIYDCSRFDATLRRRRQHAVLEERHADNTYSVRTPKTKQTNAALGWEDVRNLRRGVITRRVTDDTRPGGAHRPKDRVQWSTRTA